jgi:hypothetical protein
MKWILIIVTVVALIYLFAGSKAAQQASSASDKEKSVDGKAEDVLINTSAQLGNTVNNFTPAALNTGYNAPKLNFLIVAPSPAIDTVQKSTDTNLKYV